MVVSLPELAGLQTWPRPIAKILVLDVGCLNAGKGRIRLQRSQGSLPSHRCFYYHRLEPDKYTLKVRCTDNTGATGTDTTRGAHFRGDKRKSQARRELRSDGLSFLPEPSDLIRAVRSNHLAAYKYQTGSCRRAGNEAVGLIWFSVPRISAEIPTLEPSKLTKKVE